MRPPLPEYLAFLDPYGPAIIKLALATRKLVLQEAPDAVELIYDAYSAVSAGYSFTGRPSETFIYVAAYTKRVNLGFYWGATMPDPAGLLRGAGKQSRHVPIEKVSDLENPALVKLIRVAIAEAERPAHGAPEAVSSVRAIYPRKRRPVRRAR